MNSGVLDGPCRRSAAIGIVAVLALGCTAPWPVEGLGAVGPRAELAAKLELFGRLVGDWDVEVTYHLEGGGTLVEQGEWHFGWILEGRAIQDVWLVPTRAEHDRSDTPWVGYGTTIRFYDLNIDAWRAVWHGVVSGAIHEFVARERDGEIVMKQEGADEPERWIFSDVTPESFRWRAVSSRDGGQTSTIDQEMVARRRSALAGWVPWRLAVCRDRNVNAAN